MKTSFTVHFMMSIVLLTGTFGRHADSQNISSGQQLVDKIISHSATIKYIKFDLYAKERFGSRWVETPTHFKIEHTPRKIYMKNMDVGVELLYLDNWNNNKCYINTNGFPYVNVSFSPLSDKVRQEQHHTLFEAGFWYIAQTLGTLSNQIKKEQRDPAKHFILHKDVTISNKSYYHLELRNDDFAWVDYIVQGNETPRDIAQRLNLTEYMIEEKNKLGHGKIGAGKTIKIPNTYAKKIIFYVDKQTYLPVVQELFDDKGLYEHYEYTNVVVNPSFTNDEFSENNSAYGFH